MGTAASIFTAHPKCNQLEEVFKRLAEDTKGFKYMVKCEEDEVFHTHNGTEFPKTTFSSAVNSPTMIFTDERKELSLEQKEYLTTPEESANRGVTIAFLVAFCRAWNLWDVPTSQVRRDYIIPMTSKQRCRFVELPVIVEAGVVGPAATYICHSWNGIFGDLVAAVSDSADHSRRVLIDLFAFRQWPCGPSNELSIMEKVIERCPSFLVACPSLPEMRDGIDPARLSAEVKAKLPFFQAGCLLEIYHAARLDKAIVMKCGRHRLIPKKGEGKSSNSQLVYTFVVDSPVLTYNFVDIRAAVVTSRHDEQLISQKIAEAIDTAALKEASEEIRAPFKGGGSSSNKKAGAGAVNRLLRVAITAAYATSEHSLLQSAACGDQSAIQAVRSQAEQFLPLTAEGGYLTLLTELLVERGDLVNLRSELDHTTLLMLAARGGHLPCVQYLVEKAGADSKAVSRGGWTAQSYARHAGHQKIVQYLSQ